MARTRRESEPAAMSVLEEVPVRFRHIVGACVLSLAAMSCSLSEPGEQGVMNVLIDVSDSQLTVGQESVTFTVTALNVGYEPLTLSGPSDCLLFVEVRDVQGSVVWNSNSSCLGPTVAEVLAAGAQRDQTFSWNGTNLGGVPLAPGLYNARAVARVADGTFVSSSTSISLD